MGNEKKRVALDLGGFDDDSAPINKIDPDKIKEVSRESGFSETPSRKGQGSAKRKELAAHEAEREPIVKRRARRKTGRVHQFATRVDAKTLEAIYDYSDQNDITLAEVIERAMISLNKSK